VDQIRAELSALVAGATFGATFEEIQAFDAHVSALFGELVWVVETELVRAGGGSVETVSDVDVAA
jgi:uncharacterized membrane protein YagU involved in acid resistance